MDDTSFIDLISEENISKLKIDERLVIVFKKAMINFQRYFNYMGYTKTRNYQEFFNKYLLTHYGIRKLAFKCNIEPSRIDSMGLYDLNKKHIVIDPSYLDNESELLGIFTHEFIHFLVHHNCYDKQQYDYVKNNPFINEALTEMLTNNILPYGRISYLELIKIIKFWLILNNKKVDFNLFLNEGKFYEIDEKLEELFQSYFEKKEQQDKIYIEIQRYLINSIDVNISGLEEYEEIIKKVSKRAIDDEYFINKFYRKVERNLINNLNISYDNIKEKYLIYLKEYRQIIEKLESFRKKTKSKLSNKIEFTMDSKKHELDYRGKLFINNQFFACIKEIKIFLKDNSERVIKIKNIDFNHNLNINKNLQEDLEKKKKQKEDILNYLKFINDLEVIDELDEKNIGK